MSRDGQRDPKVTAEADLRCFVISLRDSCSGRVYSSAHRLSSAVWRGEESQLPGSAQTQRESGQSGARRREIARGVGTSFGFGRREGPMKGVIQTPDIAKIFHPTPDIRGKKCPTLKIPLTLDTDLQKNGVWWLVIIHEVDTVFFKLTPRPS